MGIINTLAWVLYRGEKNNDEEAILKKETISFGGISENEALIEPIFGCWETNMTHALERKPVDVCRKRGESKVVLGNSGIARIIDTGAKVTHIRKGDLCVFLPYGPSNRWGCLDKYFGFGFDEPGTIGMLAKQTRVMGNQMYPIPKNSKIALYHWPIISVRYSTAWSNWKVTEKCWRAQVSQEENPSPCVFAWGGGVSLGELRLAKEQGFKVAMIASTDERLEYIKNLGIIPVDRREFPDLSYVPGKLESERDYRKKYFASLNKFRKAVDEITEGEGVSIFIDNIGLPVYPATLRVLGRPGIITTSGWKAGMHMEINRALECHERHIHIFTHALKLSEGDECIKYALENNWIPREPPPIYDWEDIPQLAHDFANKKINSYFPTFRVNPL